MKQKNFFHKITEKNPEVGQIIFRSVATGKEVTFPAFITQYSDGYTMGFGGETVFGRNDPVKHYTSTTRTIQTAFDILGTDEQHSIENFKKYSKLIQMCYPVYSEPIGNSNNARTIKAPPLFRVKYANYISSPTGAGLLGVISAITFQPDFKSGQFITSDNKLVPIIYNMNFNFAPLHEATLGWSEGGNFLTKEFPYKFDSSVHASALKL